METWKDIPGYEGLYRVSDNGNILSVKKNKCRKLRKDKWGYSIIGLNKCGKQKIFFVHRIVAQAFCQNPNVFNEINHIDGDKSNNKAKNLEWCDHKTNITHAYATGLMKQHKKKKPEKKPQRNKLSKDIAQRIRNEHKDGVRGCGCKSLAKKYGVSDTTIKSIIRNKLWKE